MALLGAAVITMWWKVPGDARAELEDWHSHEHFPERLSIPGFRRTITIWCEACAECWRPLASMSLRMR
jgi:hypothetical protein